MTGQTISHYKILEKLGEGGMGVVYKATDTKLERTVALKFLAADRLEDEEHKARFRREARAAAALDHPNICTVYEIDEADGQTFLAMPYLEGSTVRQKVKQRPLKLDEALDIAIQAGEGLRAAHAKGIVHRDIKSANLMVSPQGQVKVMDFGLAQAADQSLLTKTETLLGTPVYMSPEQALRLPTDRRTDIWSLGIVIYEMLIGRTPFEGEREQAVLYGIVQEEPEPITSQRARVPLDLDWVVSKALAKDKEERYPHIDDMLVDLRAVARQVAEESDTGRPSKRPTTKVRREAPARARRKRWAWALGIAAAAVVLTMAGLGVRNFLPTTEAPLEPLRAVPLTSYPGFDAGRFIFPRRQPSGLPVDRGEYGEFRHLRQGGRARDPSATHYRSCLGSQPRLVAGRPPHRLSPRASPSQSHRENGLVPDSPSWRDGTQTRRDPSTVH